MKLKLPVLAASAVLIILGFGAGVWAASTSGTFLGYPIVQVIVNGHPVRGDTPAISFHNRTMVPVRFVSQALGATVAWNGRTQTVTVTTHSAGPIPSQGATASAQCRAQPLAGVYHPSRLIVKDPCKTASGVVASIKHEADKDIHINVRLDAKSAGLINAANTKYEHGDLVVEVIPMDAGAVTPPPSARRSRSLALTSLIRTMAGWKFTLPGSSTAQEPPTIRRPRQLHLCKPASAAMAIPTVLPIHPFPRQALHGHRAPQPNAPTAPSVTANTEVAAVRAMAASCYGLLDLYSPTVQ